MSKLLRGALIMLLASISILAQAELYSWVDKNGKKHYGDKIPAEYAKQAKTVEVKKANTMQTPPTVNFYQPPARSNQNTTPNDPRLSRDDASNIDPNSCEARQRAYQDSQACYSDCRLQRNHNHNANNVSACGHCQDVRKPDCN